jgi:glycosyltransferase involved in cell wall biosynthesis
MKVIFIPFSKDNPYQKMLAAALGKSGVAVVDGIGFSNSFFTLSLFKLLAANWKPDILHIHWLEPFIFNNSMIVTVLKSVVFLIDILIVRLLDIRVVWTVHNLEVHDGKFAKLEFVIISLFARLCNGIIVHTDSALDEVTRHYGVAADITAVIPHGNYIDSYRNDISRHHARKKLGIPHDGHMFLYFGKIRPYKGLDKLIEVFNGIDKTNTKLVIAGKAPNETMAHDIQENCLASQNIMPVISFIPHDEVQIYMNAADVVVLPYRNIFTSGALLLAMSFGKPIIAPATGSIPDILDSHGGFLYDPADPSGLKKAIEYSLNRDLAEMGKYNYEKVKKYDWDSIAGKTHAFYKKHINRAIVEN